MFSVWKFENKRTDEQIITTLRRHPIVLLKGLFQILVVLIFVIGMVIFFGFTLLTSLIIVASLLIMIIIAAYHLYLWYNDLYVLTNHRLIDIDQNNLFSRSVSETTLDQIQDVRAETQGLAETVFGFGKVIIQTAGTQENLILEVIPQPYKVQHQISQAFYDYRQKMGLVKKQGDNEQNLG